MKEVVVKSIFAGILAGAMTYVFSGSNWLLGLSFGLGTFCTLIVIGTLLCRMSEKRFKEFTDGAMKLKGQFKNGEINEVEYDLRLENLARRTSKIYGLKDVWKYIRSNSLEKRIAKLKSDIALYIEENAIDEEQDPPDTYISRRERRLSVLRQRLENLKID